MNVLFLTMEFPPMNAPGVFRPLRFIKGLREYGIKPIVITFELDGYLKSVHKKIDTQLLKEVPENLEVHRIPLDDLGHYYTNRAKEFVYTYFNVSDKFGTAWRKNLFEQLPFIIERSKPDAIYATAPPFSAAVVAAEISERYRLPLILDMRDAWAQLSMGPLGSYFHFVYKRNLERRAFSQASAIVTVTPQLKQIFQETHPAIPRDKFHLIYNGFDFDLPSRQEVKSESINNKETFHIGYVGSFYYSPSIREGMLKPWWKKKGHRMLQYTPMKEDWLYRSPYFFLRTMKQLFEKNPGWKKKLFFHHIGETPDWLSQMGQEMGLSSNLVVHGFQPLHKTLELQQRFDVLLTTSEKVLNNEHYCLPSKLFTYLRAGKPVLAFVTKGIQRDFVENSGMGVIVDPDDEMVAAKKMEALLQNGYQSDLNMSYLQQFARPVVVQQLLSLIKQVTTHSPMPFSIPVTA